MPWLPQGKDEAATNFPKANDLLIDEIIKEEKECDKNLNLNSQKEDKTTF